MASYARLRSIAVVGAVSLGVIAAVAEAQVNETFEERISGPQIPTPGSEIAVRKFAEGLMSGAPDYASMTLELARFTRQHLRNLQRDLTALGPIQSVEFSGVDAQRHDVYVLRHEQGSATWRIGLNAAGRVSFATVRMQSER